MPCQALRSIVSGIESASERRDKRMERADSPFDLCRRDARTTIVNTIVKQLPSGGRHGHHAHRMTRREDGPR